jgi:two-component system cell cycle response regulator
MSHDDGRRRKPLLDGESDTLFIARAPLERAKTPLLRGYLTVIRGAGHDLGSYVVIESSVSIGRGRDVDLRLQDDGVSRHHLCIDRNEDGSHVLSELGSTNGTYVGGQAVDAARILRDGDKIFLGDTVLRFALADDIDLGYQTEVAQIVGQDPLTGLESKRRFDDALAYVIAASLQSDVPLALLMMDMDGVKSINDTYGHLFGAHVIGETGRILARNLEHAGQACRFGGDEFCAFLPDQDRDAARDTAEAIRLAVEQAGMNKNGIPLAPTLSIGIAVCPADAEDATELLARADAALYRAKAAGKNRVAV